ncbi:MAG: LPXTG cell wall anchor domain-containing protein [Bergeyella sp.]|nr:LPXTG cell wall anchor domain-containing protein [Bergeyella sp.]
MRKAEKRIIFVVGFTLIVLAGFLTIRKKRKQSLLLEQDHEELTRVYPEDEDQDLSYLYAQ